MSMRTSVTLCLVVPCFLSLTMVAGKGQDLSAEQVSIAIRNGVNFLSRKQQSNGGWLDIVGDTRHKFGVSALVTLSLLSCGVPSDDPRITRALSHLERANVRELSTYSVSLVAMCYALANPDRYAAEIRACVERLEETQLASGGWSYPTVGGTSGDASNSQFALLALHEARLAGVDVSEEVWRKAWGYWSTLRDDQDGGYNYGMGMEASSGSMTSAAIASLIIIDENLGGENFVKADGSIDCCAIDGTIMQVDGAAAWLGQHFKVSENPGKRSHHFRSATYYYLYALERAGRMSGRRFLGQYDWYREGADYLLGQRRGNGWRGSSHGEQIEEVATSFALLFLSKGLRPVVIGKYQHSSSGDWDRHRKGVHFLTRSLEQDWRMQLNWQSIDGRVATANDLMETPVLFFSGRDSLDLNAEQKKHLKQYLEYGRFIFAEACQGDGCADDNQNSEFDKKFRSLMAELFPESPLTELPPTHPIWTSQYKLQPDARWPVLGIQTSCRTAVVYVPSNMSCYWQADRPGVRQRLNERTIRNVDYCLQLAGNIIAYATGREVRSRLDAPKVVESGSGGNTTYEIVIPKLIHAGGANDAPNAWENILRRAKVDLKQEFRTEQVLIRPTSETLAQYPMVFMHGRNAFSFDEDERDAIRKYLTEDGFLFADSVCASQAFAESFRREMASIFPEAEFSLQRLATDHVMFSDQLGGYDLRSVTIRRPSETGVIARSSVPQLEGITIHDRLAVVFSPYDLSCAMESAAASTCEGYDKDDASKIGVNLLLFVLSQ